MKYTIALLLYCLSIQVAWSQHQHGLPASKEKSVTGYVYTCPMHPAVKSDMPGKCPTCGMALQKKKLQAAPKASPQKPAFNNSNKRAEKAGAQPAGNNNQHLQAGPPATGNEPVNQHEHGDNKSDEPMANIPQVDMQPGKTVTYHLYITDTIVNYTGRQRHAYAINGSLPGPELHFTEGDTAAIYLHNLLQNEETSLHWHGVILPNQFDGVPYLTTAPIHPGDVHLYKFKVVQNGTYWYHSHSGLQEQAGLYGALIFHKRPGQQQPLSTHPLPAMDSTLQQHPHSHQSAPQEATATDAHGRHLPKNAAANDPHAAHRPANNANGDVQHRHHAATGMPAMGNGSYNAEMAVVLSEWTDEKPTQVQRRLRTANDWYAIKKGSTQSYSEAIAAGHLGTKLTNEWKRMNAMDVSDVYYNHFLINGSTESRAPQFKKGDRVRLRLVNAGGSSYFWVQYGGGKLTVIGNDGNEVEPIEVDRLIIGVSETYDVVVTLPDSMSYEFRVTPEDRTKAASLWLGSGMKMAAPHLHRLKYFEGMKMMNNMMKMNGNMKEMDMEMTLQKMDMNSVMYPEASPGNSKEGGHSHQHETTAPVSNMTDMQGVSNLLPSGGGGAVTLNYSMLRSLHTTTLPDAPYKTLEFELTGNMNRYVWSINKKVLKEWDKIMIEKGHNVRIVLFNNSMMRHPMHLHGHDFRVLNGHGEYAPLKNVLDIMPMERDTIEFAGSQDGDWFFHCHILYHMMAGMGNVFSYKNALPNPDLPDKTAAYNRFLRHEQMLHPMLEVALESNGSDGQLMLAGDRYEWRTEWRLGVKDMHGYEVETYLGRYVGKMQWWYPFIGFDYHRNTRENQTEKNLLGQLTNQNNRKALVAGVEYTLPMLVRAQARVDSKGKFRFQLSREDVPLTPRLRLNAMWNTDREYMAGLRYVVRKWLALSTHYDSDMGYGAGVAVTY